METPRPHSTGHSHSHSLKAESSPWSHRCKRGTRDRMRLLKWPSGRSQLLRTRTSPQTGGWSGLLSWDGKAPIGPKLATGNRLRKHLADWAGNVLLEPRAWAFLWHLVRKHNGGSHRLCGSDTMPGPVRTACPAACLSILTRTLSRGLSIKSILQIRKLRPRHKSRYRVTGG